MSYGNVASIILSFVIALTAASPVLATDFEAKVRGEVRGDMKEHRDDNRENKDDKRPGFFEKLFNFTSRAAIAGGEITAINGTGLVIKKDDKSITVKTDGNTQFRRRFWGKSDLSEFKVGHSVSVVGSWTDDTQTTINAKLVRDFDIQKRFGVFFGNVKSLTNDGWVMSTVSNKRPDQTVTVSSETKFVNRDEQSINKSDVQVGHKVRVKGLWDNEFNTVTEVKHVKDFDLPVKVTTTVSATATTTPTP